MERHVRSRATKRKTKVDYRKDRSLAALEDCAVFTSLIQRMRSSKKLLTTRGESWKFRCHQLCLARSGEENTKKTCRNPDAPKTRYAWIVGADESTRGRLERKTLHEDHEDHIAGTRINSLNHYNPVHTFILMPEAMKYQMQKQQWAKNDETRENTGLAADASQKQKRGDR